MRGGMRGLGGRGEIWFERGKGQEERETRRYDDRNDMMTGKQEFPDDLVASAGAIPFAKYCECWSIGVFHLLFDLSKLL
jgi:hypothetical protein